MKTYSMLALAALSLALAGCGKNDTAQPPQSNPPSTTPSAPKATNTADNTPASGGSMLTAPVDYLAASVKAEITTEKKVDVVAINQAIQQFSVQEGRNPTDLDELVSKKYMRFIPKPPYGYKIVYDATAGEVSVVKE